MYLGRTNSVNMCKQHLRTKINLFPYGVFVKSRHLNSNREALFPKITAKDLNTQIDPWSEHVGFSAVRIHTDRNPDSKFGVSSKTRKGNKCPQLQHDKGLRQKPSETINKDKQIPPAGEKKSTFFNSKLLKDIRSHKSKIITLFVGMAGIYYFTHLEVDPITGRKKFHLFSKHQVITLGDIQSERFTKKYRNRIEKSGTNYNRVAKIVNSLLAANSDLSLENHGRSWDIFIVDNGRSISSIVLSNGHVFVYSGLLETVDDDNQLAALLAHEMAHVVLNHSAENPTWNRIFLSILLFPLVAVYSVLPGFVGAVLYPVLKPLSVIAMKRPMGKKLEKEADSLSVEMVSKACFDPRKAKVFWMSMESLRRKKTVKLLRTHPIYSRKSRYHNFDSLMPKAFNILAKHCAGSLHPFR